MKIFFDAIEIDGNGVMGLHQTVKPYNNNFTIGNTICRQFEIQLKKEYYSSIPNKIILKDDSDNVLATLLIDSYDDQNDDYTTFELTDIMVRFNTALSYTVNQTVLQILQGICTAHSITLATTNLYMSDFSITWEDQLTEREFISYVAEVNGGYAYIDNNGNLNIASYSNTVAGTVDANYCSDIKIGDQHHIDRVYLEQGTATSYYPETGTYDTLYLNRSNILYTENTMYPSYLILQHIHSIVNDLIFTNVQIGRCPVTNARAGQMLNLTNFGENAIPFICTIDYDYYTGWNGGYDSQFENKLQEETKVVSEGNLQKRIEIIVDRETGAISQEVANLSDQLTQSVSSIMQTASGLEVRVKANEQAINNDPNSSTYDSSLPVGISQRMSSYELAVNIDSTGVRIAQGAEGTYSLFGASEIGFYVQGVKNTTIKSDGMTSEEVMIGGPDDSQKWHMHMANNGYTLMFLRR